MSEKKEVESEKRSLKDDEMRERERSSKSSSSSKKKNKGEKRTREERDGGATDEADSRAKKKARKESSSTRSEKESARDERNGDGDVKRRERDSDAPRSSGDHGVSKASRDEKEKNSKTSEKRDGDDDRSRKRDKEKRDGDRDRKRHRERSKDRRHSSGSKRHRSESRSKSDRRSDSKSKYSDRDERREYSRRKERERSEEKARREERRREEEERRKEDEEVAAERKAAAEAVKKEPLTMEQLIRRREAKETARPVFMTKAQREAAALARLEERRAEQKRLQEEQQKQRRAFLEATRDEAKRDERAKESGRSNGDSQSRKASKSTSSSTATAAKSGSAKEGAPIDELGAFVRQTTKDEEERKLEMEAIKRQHLGEAITNEPVVIKKKTFGKSKVESFDWDLTDDTSQDPNPLYRNRMDVRPLFGRGLYGGVDKREQIKRYRDFLSKEKGKEQRASAHERSSTGTERSVRDLTIEKLEREEARMKRELSAERHWTEKARDEMRDRDWRIFREDHNIRTKGGSIPHPYRAWKEADLPLVLLDAIKDAGYKKPTPIQMAALPISLNGRDLLGVAETGSGKTAAFLLPMLKYVSQQPTITREKALDGPYCLVMAPTRELAVQIKSEVDKLSKYMKLRCVCVIGGQAIGDQGAQLARGVEIVIATPGRLIDLIENSYLVLNQCYYVVLDEADKMIEMGFEEQVVKVLEAMPATSWKSEDEKLAVEQERLAALAGTGGVDGSAKNFRTTQLFSATFPVEVERLAQKYLRRPATIYIGDPGQAVKKIKQDVIWVHSDQEKMKKVISLLTDGPKPPIIIFVNKKKGCDALSRGLSKLGWRTATLHSGRTQDQRERAITQFKEGKIDILIATDVLSRGIDIAGVSHVIQHDISEKIQTYTHRIGRTGRAGAEGLATTLIGESNKEIFYDLLAYLKKSGQLQNAPKELLDHPMSKIAPGAVIDPKKARRLGIPVK